MGMLPSVAVLSWLPHVGDHLPASLLVITLSYTEAQLEEREEGGWVTLLGKSVGSSMDQRR